MQTFVELQPGSGLPQDTARLLQFWQKYYPETENKLREKGLWTRAGSPSTYGLQPLLAMHHATETDGVNPKYAWILLAIGGVILLIAASISPRWPLVARRGGRGKSVCEMHRASRQQLSRHFLTGPRLSRFSTALGWDWLAVLPTLISVGKELSFNFPQFPELWWLVPTQL